MSPRSGDPVSGDPVGDGVTPDATAAPVDVSPEELASAAARLGYRLGPQQLSDMHAAVAAAAPAVTRLRDRPPAGNGARALGAADPAHGNRWAEVVGVNDLAQAAAAVGQDDDDGAGDALALLGAYRNGSRDPVAEVDAALSRLERAHALLNCTIRVLAQDARSAAGESARRWRTGTARLLEGVPFVVKDVIDVAGVPTTAGSALHGSGDPPAESATVVARLVAAGAIPISKDNTTEFAVGGPHPPRFGACRNPWDTGRWAGGSSTGTAAAIAARVTPFGLGTDVGGSVRLPAAWCGLTGLKPTAGAIPRTGVWPLSWTTETTGPIARSARDIALLFAVLRGPDGLDPRAGVVPDYRVPERPADLRGLRVAVPGGYFEQLCDDAVRANRDALVAELVEAGAQVVAGELPSAADALVIGYQIVFTEAAALHRIDVERWAEYDPVTVRRISQGITTPAYDYLRALQFRAQLQAELDAVFTGADLIVLPTCPSTAPELPDCTVTVNGERYPLYAAQSRSTMLGNLTGAPGLAVPTGLAPDGCPTSALLMAPPHREDVTLRAALFFQSVTSHHQARPALADRIS
jgi:aspartyl-tRNA(Asn)/glutamyl-tRNA(Gln) amidotransferase subunit A